MYKNRLTLYLLITPNSKTDFKASFKRLVSRSTLSIEMYQVINCFFAFHREVSRTLSPADIVPQVRYIISTLHSHPTFSNFHDMSSTSITTPTALAEAINFLTQPLSGIMPLPTINSLQQILLSTFTAVPAWVRNGCFTLTCSSAVPPRAIHVACIALNVIWKDWFYVLGGREFDLTIKSTVVSVKIMGIPGRIVVWKQAPAVPTILVSDHELDARARAPSFDTMRPVPVISYAPPQTLAQQLLYSEHEKEETDEMFSMISKLNVGLISPTPTRECFNPPGSEMMRMAVTTRLSSIYEEEFLHSESYLPQTTSRFDRNTPSPISSLNSSRTGSPSSTRSSPINAIKKSSTRVAVEPLPPRDFESISRTVPSRVQRYLYLGGQSTVLTGGVMLGKASPRRAITASTSNGVGKITRNNTGPKNLIGLKPRF
jgi:hypothetical protein